MSFIVVLVAHNGGEWNQMRESHFFSSRVAMSSKSINLLHLTEELDAVSVYLH